MSTAFRNTVERQLTYPWKAASVAERLDSAVIAVDAARLVPEQAIGCDCPTTCLFRARVSELRAEWSDELRDEHIDLESTVKPFDDELASSHDDLGRRWLKQASILIQACDIDHSLPGCVPEHARQRFGNCTGPPARSFPTKHHAVTILP